MNAIAGSMGKMTEQTTMTLEQAERWIEQQERLHSAAWDNFFLAMEMGADKLLGMTTLELAQRMLHKAKLTMEERIPVEAKLIDEGHSNVAIANALGVTETTVRNDIRSNVELQEKKAKKNRAAKEQNRSNSEPPPPPVMLTLKTHLGEEVPYQKPKSKPTFNQTNEHISWAAWSWNPVTGCLHGCTYCYARELANKASYADTYPVGFTPLFHHERLDAPANTRVPEGAATDPRKKRVFVCSMADLYGKWVPDEWIEQVHAPCIANPQWDYLMLTKFPRRYVGLQLPPTAWLGTSVDEQKRVRLAEEAFSQIKNVRVKWLSLEPLLAPLKFNDLSMFDWIVIGSQSATEQPDGRVAEFAPPFEWVSRIVAQARECGCRVYCKPNLMGETSPQSPGMKLPQEEPLIAVHSNEISACA